MQLNDLPNEAQAVILANGSYPRHEIPLDLLKNAAYLVCCDGAINELALQHITPDVIIGDGDSISEENRRRFNDIFIQVDDQETNDQTKAISFLGKKGIKNVIILGATGGREDHALGNISLLIDYMHQGFNVMMYTNYGLFIPMNDDNVFTTFTGQQISIFSFGAKGLLSDGLKYPLHELTNWWQGTLNEAIGDEVSIKAKGDYLVYLEYPQ